MPGLYSIGNGAQRFVHARHALYTELHPPVPEETVKPQCHVELSLINQTPWDRAQRL